MTKVSDREKFILMSTGGRCYGIGLSRTTVNYKGYTTDCIKSPGDIDFPLRHCGLKHSENIEDPHSAGGFMCKQCKLGFSIRP